VKQYAVVISATLVLVATWIGLQFVAPRSHSLVWLLVPAWAGAFWWIDGYRIRDVATWVIPLTVVMAAAQLVPATAAIEWPEAPGDTTSASWTHRARSRIATVGPCSLSPVRRCDADELRMLFETER
jgi:hypothetical protein